MFKNLKYFWPYISPIKFRYFLTLLITIPIGLMDGVVPWAMQPMMDGLQTGSRVSPEVLNIPYIILGLSLMQGMLQYVSTYLNTYVGQTLAQNIRTDLYRRMLKIKVEVLQAQTSGFFVTSVYNDPLKAQSVLMINPRVMLGRIASVIAITAVMFSLNIKLCLIALLVAFTLVLPMTLVRSKVIKAAKQEHGMIGNILSLLNNTLSGVKLIYSYQLQGFISKRLIKMHEFLYHKAMRITKAEAILSPISYIVTAAGITIILLLSVDMIEKGEMTSGTLVAFVASLLLLYRPMRNIGNTLVQLQKDNIALERIREFLDRKDWLMPDYSQRKELDKLERSIELDNVCFSYENRPDVEVLKNLSFTMEAGKVYALVGRSGSGKTTLAEILMGLFPDSQVKGDIRFDGHSIHDLNLNQLRTLMSYVSQDTTLFDGTLEENIRLGNLNATNEELWNAIEHAQLKTFIEGLPDGLQTAVGERGSQLSGGQRQRVAIARAFLHNGPILILDEATSALDNEAEVAIQSSLDQLMVGRTTLVIAHRLSTVQYAHQILVMDKGQLIEYGTHEELLKKEGLYYLLFNAQAFRQERKMLQQAELQQA